MPTPGTMIVSRAFTTVTGEIPYWEFKNSYGESFCDDGVSITNCLGCFWKDRIKFVTAMLGFPYISGVAGTSGAKLRRKLPEPHPDFRGIGPTTGLDPAYAWDMQFLDGLGWEGRNTVTNALAMHDSAPSYDPSTGVFSRPPNDQGLALYMVTFRPRIYLVQDDDTADADATLEQSRFTSFNREPAGESLTLPKAILYFGANDPVALDALATQLFPTAIINYTWHEIPAGAAPIKAIEGYGAASYTQGMMNSVNATTFLGKDPGTLLGLAPTVRKYQSRTTDILEDYTFHFVYRPMGHNNFLRNTGVWAPAYRSYDHGTTIDTTKGAFLPFEFSKIFDVSNA